MWSINIILKHVFNIFEMTTFQEGRHVLLPNQVSMTIFYDNSFYLSFCVYFWSYCISLQIIVMKYRGKCCWVNKNVIKEFMPPLYWKKCFEVLIIFWHLLAFSETNDWPLIWSFPSLKKTIICNQSTLQICW